MQREAQTNAEADKRKVELIDARNQADQMVWQMEKLLKENADKVSETDKAPIQSAIEKVKQAAKGDDANAIKQAVNDLQQASHAMAQHLYSKQGPQGGGAGGPGGPQAPGGGPSGPQSPTGDGKEDVIDAEFEVKK
jgi:molecular chaperone DnaK